jgi:uncharacterized membrane protein YdbT with pleckstrin-like domain
MIELNKLTPYPPIAKWYTLTKITLIILVFSAPFTFGGFEVWLGSIFLAAILFGLPITAFSLIHFKTKSFIVENDKITINKGVLTRTSKSIPFDRIQNVTCVSGLLMRLFGITKINIWTASHSQLEDGTSIDPDGLLVLLKGDAEYLKNTITNRPPQEGFQQLNSNQANQGLAQEIANNSALPGSGTIPAHPEGFHQT